MTADNRRNGTGTEAKVEDLEGSSIPPPHGAMADIAGREPSSQPENPQYAYTPSMDSVVRDYNISEAMKAVIANKGAPGVDGITVGEIRKFMGTEWPHIRQAILEGRYHPNPVRRVEIPKPDGQGTRKLGIPTVMDRIIQQALYQELVRVYEPTFSENSYGFRPGRRASQAVFKAKEYIQEGCEWVVDIDLEKFFDRVNHDILMSKIAKVIKDKKILLLIRRFLQAGVMEDGLIKPTDEGTPQGGPLSPLLSNIMLNDFDKELEERGLRFARYADDCNIYVKSEKAGHRVMQSVVKFITTRLKLKVNESKSAVDRPWNRKFLGFTFSKGKDPSEIKVHESRIKKLKDKIRGLTKKMRGSNVSRSIQKLIMPITRGWTNYFGIAENRKVFEGLDGWIRRKIRAIMWRQWKRARTRMKKLMGLGLTESTARKHAYSSKGPWRMARSYGMHRGLSNEVIEEMGYVSMLKMASIRS